MRILVSGSTKVVAALAGQYPDHLGILLTPSNGNSVASVLRTGLPWGVDNGAYSGLDVCAFRRLLSRIAGQPRCLFVAAPDVVGDARATLSLWTEWFCEIEATGQQAAYVLQDGQEDLALPTAGAYFVGGTTRWKLSAACGALMATCKAGGAYLHLGRVNSMQRLRMAWDREADSVDGSSYSRFYHRTLTHRPDMNLERHLRFIRSLEKQPLFP